MCLNRPPSRYYENTNLPTPTLTQKRRDFIKELIISTVDHPSPIHETMETLYSSHLHSLRTATALATNNITMHTIGAPWTTQGGLVALGVVLGSSISLVGLAFSFITYR